MTQTEGMEAKPKRARKRRQRQIAYLAICGVSVAVFGFALASLIRPSSAQTEVAGNGAEGQAQAGAGATHDQAGQLHFATVGFTEYKPTVNYTKEPVYSSVAMDPVYNITHLIFDAIMTDDPPIPPGYIVIKDEDTLALGPKAEQNDWRELLTQYWLILLWVLFLAILIVLIPFIAVCYCCFCCCRRCSPSVPPCDRKRDASKRCCFGFLLLLLIIGLLFGVIIAFVTNKMLDRGFQETSTAMKRGSEDTCKYLKDVSDHIHHLFVYNYQEMESHLTQELNEAHKHIFIDLSNASESNAIEELLRILENMPQALVLMNQVDKLEKEIRFLATQLRDGLRGVKRDVNFAAVNLCGVWQCRNFLQTSEIEFVDLSPCLHYEEMPNTTIFVEAIEQIIEKKYVEIPKKALKRLLAISDKVKDQMKVVIPPLVRDLVNGRDLFRQQATNVRNIVDAVLSDIQQNTKHSTRAFDDVYERFGPDRDIINIVVCILLMLILGILIIALLYGCCGKRPRGYRDNCCNKGTGASCLLLAIVLIFATFSLITIVGLFYFMLGLVTYHGACAPLRDQQDNALFRQLDSVVDLNRYLPLGEKAAEAQLPPLRMSNAINACQANQSIFELLRLNNLYDINDLTRIKVMTESGGDGHGLIFTEDLSKVVILTKEEKLQLNEMRNGNLSTYHSRLYTEMLCRPFTPVNLRNLASSLRSLANQIDWPNPHRSYAWVSFMNEAYNLETYDSAFVGKLSAAIDRITEKLLQIDKLILYENHNFSRSINILVDSVVRSEDFIQNRGKDFINALGANLTSFLEHSVSDYIEMVIKQSNENVGHCAPLASIYDQGVDMICHRLVDPMNGFWFGVLLCCLLFLPTLWVAHKLMCLYKRRDPYVTPAAAIIEGGDYLYDAYSEREHMPLANAPKKRRKGYDRRREQQEYYEDASPSVSRAARAEGAGSSNMRYNDMAPKHWDHEPPRYQNPPAAPPSSEYERPPPYYYPGAAEQD